MNDFTLNKMIEEMRDLGISIQARDGGYDVRWDCDHPCKQLFREHVWAIEHTEIMKEHYSELANMSINVLDGVVFSKENMLKVYKAVMHCTSNKVYNDFIDSIKNQLDSIRLKQA